MERFTDIIQTIGGVLIVLLPFLLGCLVWCEDTSLWAKIALSDIILIMFIAIIDHSDE